MLCDVMICFMLSSSLSFVSLPQAGEAAQARGARPGRVLREPRSAAQSIYYIIMAMIITTVFYY